MSSYFSFDGIVTPDVFDGFQQFTKRSGSYKTVSFDEVSSQHINEALALIEENQHNYSIEISNSTIDQVILGNYRNVKFEFCVMESLKYPHSPELLFPDNITLNQCDIGMNSESRLFLTVFAKYHISFEWCSFGGFSEIDEVHDLTYRNWVCVKAAEVVFSHTHHDPEKDFEISVCATESFECHPTALMEHMTITTK